MTIYQYFAEDKGDRFEYLNEDSLKSINKTIEEIKRIAIDNLTKYFNSKGVSIEGDENMQMIKFDHNMESSLLLIDTLWTQIIVKQKDDIIIAVPSRELLIITTYSNHEAIEQLKKGAIDLFNNGKYKLTKSLLQKSLDGTLKKFE